MFPTGSCSKQNQWRVITHNENDNFNKIIDRVALVAAPPSYTRMYHYFPAQLTHPFCYYPPAPQTARYPGTAFIRINGDKKHGGDDLKKKTLSYK